MNHLSFERLVDLAEARLLGADAATARAHIAGCTECKGTLAEVERVIQLMRHEAATQSAEEPPRHVVQRALRLVRNRQRRPIRRIVAELLFDSATRPLAAAGVRAFDSAGRQLVFAAGEYELDLRLAGVAEHRYELRGQLLGPCTGEGRVVLTADSAQSAEAALNELCEFEVRVPTGTYALTVHLREVSIEVSDLQIQS